MNSTTKPNKTILITLIFGLFCACSRPESLAPSPQEVVQPSASPLSKSTKTQKKQPEQKFIPDAIRVYIAMDTIRVDASDMYPRLEAAVGKQEADLLWTETQGRIARTSNAQPPHPQAQTPHGMIHTTPLDGGHFRDRDKRGGAQSLFVQPLFDAVHELTTLESRLVSLERGKTQRKRTVVFSIAPEVPYKTIVSATYTLSQARVEHFYWVVPDAEGREKALEIDTPRLSVGPPASGSVKRPTCILPHVHMTPKQRTWSAVWAFEGGQPPRTHLQRSKLSGESILARIGAMRENSGGTSLVDALEEGGAKRVSLDEAFQAKPFKPKPAKEPKPTKKPEPDNIAPPPKPKPIHPYEDLTGVCSATPKDEDPSAALKRLKTLEDVCPRLVVSTEYGVHWGALRGLVSELSGETFRLQMAIAPETPKNASCPKGWFLETK